MNRSQMHATCCAVIATLSIGAAHSQSALGTETPRQRETRLQWWRDARFGMFVHWGPVSLVGTEISWSRKAPRRGIGGEGTVPVEVYDNLYQRFNPTQFDALKWAELARDAGMGYVVLTAKHHDGFCLWPTQTTPYNIANTPFKRDVCGELAKAVHDTGLGLGWYFSPPDWYDPDCRSGRNAQYVSRMQEQVRELLTRYDPVDLLWWDTEGGPGPWDQPATAKMVKDLRPGIIMNDRLDAGGPIDFHGKKVGPHGDYYTPEQRVGSYDDQVPWETCMTVGTQWSWKPNDSVKSLEECIGILVRCVGGDGNLLLNVGPMPNGEIEARQAQRLRQIGAWLKDNGESVYGTRGGPYKPTSRIASTRKGRTIYLHVLSQQGSRLALPGLPRKVKSMELLGGGRVAFVQRPHEIVLTLPARAASTMDAIVKLELDGSALDIPAIDVPTAIAPWKSVRASNTYKGDQAYGPKMAFDGDPQSRWATDTGTKSAWIEAEAPTLVGFRRVEIDEAYAGRVRRFRIEVRSGAGKPWRKLLEGTQLGRFRTTVPLTKASALRLTILEATEGPTIAEVRLLP